MPRAKVIFPSGLEQNYVVGEDGVTNLFTDEKSGNLVILGEHIIEVGNLPFILERSFKKNTEKTY